VNDTRGETGAVQALGEGSSGLLTGLVFILIEDNVDATILGIAKLVPLQGCQMSADRTGGVAKAFLPEKRKIEQALDQNHVGVVAERFPCEQSAFRAGQESMRKGGADAATIEINDAMVLTAGKDHSTAEGILALRADQTHFQ
jgi:hypothetical protein